MKYGGMTCNAANMDAWMKALRNGTRVQIKGKLHAILRTGRDTVEGYCCLGVGCEAAGIEGTLLPVDPDATGIWQLAWAYGRGDAMPPREFFDWLGIDSSEFFFADPALAVDIPYLPDEDQYLHTLNDSVGLTFSQIADLIEAFGLLVREAE